MPDPTAPLAINARQHGLSDITVHDGKFLDTLKDMREWERLGARCTGCGHIGWVDKRAVLAQVGNHYLLNLRQRFHCRACGQKGGHEVLIGKLDRNV